MNKMGFGFLRLPQTKAEGGEIEWEKVNEMTDLFLARGGDYFDTAYTYLDGKSEEAIKRCVVQRHPRSSFRLADKLPSWKVKSPDECQKYFDEQLERCCVDFFDVYLLHWLNAANYEIAEKNNEFQFLQKVKAEGKAKRIGFSYHDSAALLDRILTAHPEVDIVQLQINYLDWESAGIEARKCYETAAKHGKAIVVMEPVKGGTLASLPAEAEALFRERDEKASMASWALRFVQSLDQVEIVLSGMNDIEQVKDNMRDVSPLTDDEKQLMERAAEIIRGSTAVPCTGCRYCVPNCPMKISIPDYFRMYNEITRYPNDGWKIKPSYAELTLTHGKASACIGCRSCERNCPQHLEISSILKDVAAALE